MSDQYWTRSKGVIQGPYSKEQLQQLAASRNLRPNDELSTDRSRWVSAARLSGLTFVRPGDIEQSEKQVDEDVFVPADGEPAPGNDDASRSGADELNEKAAHARAVAAMPVGQSRTIHIAQRQTGVLAGAVMALVTFVGTVVTEVALAARDVDDTMLVLAIPAALTLSAVLLALAYFGTFNEITVSALENGTAEAKVVRHVAFVPVSRRIAQAGGKEQILKRLTFIRAAAPGDSGMADILMIICIGLCCLLGAMPGLIWFALWWQLRNRGEGATHRLRIYLKGPQFRRPILMYDARVENYFATQFGAPHESEQIVDLFRSAVPDIAVIKIED